jgi:hypothetical protein
MLHTIIETQYSIAEASLKFLAGAGIKDTSEPGSAGISFHGYEGLEHSTCPEELDDLSTFLKKVLPGQ